MGGEAATTVVVTTEPPPMPPGAPRPSFRRVDSDEPARIVLHQIDPTDFELVEGFRYAGASGAWTVTPRDLPRTDLASIPRFLGWFVSRYGRHTLAALLHDHLVRNGETLDPPVTRRFADAVFREALDLLGVPYVRTQIMWAAVTFATRWRASMLVRGALAVWMLAAVSGIVALVWSVATLQAAVFVVAILAPLPFALLWGREYRAGIVGGYTLWLVALPAVVNVAAYGIYSVTERGVRRLRALGPATGTDDLPEPPPYSAR